MPTTPQAIDPSSSAKINALQRSLRSSDDYQDEYDSTFVSRWDAVIDWDARDKSEGTFFIDLLASHNKHRVLDVATGTGFHSVKLLEAGFDVTSVDGSQAMLDQAFVNARARGQSLKIAQSDWRWLSHKVAQGFDAIICLGNSFTHLGSDLDRRRALAEFYSALAPDGLLIIDQRNYDAILSNGYSSKHKYYYCGKSVEVAPVRVTDESVKMRYSFSEDEEYHLDLNPIRRDAFRCLLREAGFERVRTYGDFELVYAPEQTDFLVHVAEKSSVPTRQRFSNNWPKRSHVSVTESYYDSDQADAFYFNAWGGEDLHVGIYKNATNVRDASRATVDAMMQFLPHAPCLDVIDLGAGYGGSARRLARETNAKCTCLNLSETQNNRNRLENTKAGLNDQVEVIHGDFQDAPFPDESFDVVWSQDAFLHASCQKTILAECARLLRPGGRLIFTDLMQAASVPSDALAPIYERLQLSRMNSVQDYKEIAAMIGLEHLAFQDLSENVPLHYQAVRTNVQAKSDKISAVAGSDFVNRVLTGLDTWIGASACGHIQWGIFVFEKPDGKRGAN